jgi:hypothetical protein
MKIRISPLIMFVALVLAGCASSATHLNDHLVAADRTCQQHIFSRQIDLIRCYDSTERPVVASDLPDLLPAYDDFQAARSSAAYDYDSKLAIARSNAAIAYNAAIAASDRKLKAATASVWPSSEMERAAIRQEADAATQKACKKDGIFASPTHAINMMCERDAKMPLVRAKIPAAAAAYDDYWNEVIGAANIYDASVSPATQEAQAEYRSALMPPQAAFRSQLQAALANDAAKTEKQRQDIANILTGLASAALIVVGAAASVAAAQHPPVVQYVPQPAQNTVHIQQTNCSQFLNAVDCTSVSY